MTSPSVPVESREQPSEEQQTNLIILGALQEKAAKEIRELRAKLLDANARLASQQVGYEQFRAERDRARDLAAHLEGQLAQVAALHVKFDGGGDRSNRCANDGFSWPCATARALAAHLEAEQAEREAE